MRIPIFGMNSSDNHRWIIQIPRIAEIRHLPMYNCETLQDQLDHIFLPMWEATMRPTENPDIAQ
eukprot:gene23200-30290_t